MYHVGQLQSSVTPQHWYIPTPFYAIKAWTGSHWTDQSQWFSKEALCEALYDIANSKYSSMKMIVYKYEWGSYPKIAFSHYMTAEEVIAVLCGK